MFGRRKHKHVWSAWGELVSTGFTYSLQYRHCMDVNCNLIQQRDTGKGSAW